MMTPCRKHSGMRTRRSPNRAGRTLSLALCCLLFQSTQPRAIAQAENDSEYRVKLAFLYNFAQFVQWPEDAFSGPDAPFTMCIAGPDPFQGEIGDALGGRKAGGHPIKIKRLKADDDLRTCHMIFIRAGEKAAARKILATIKRSDTLAVGECSGFSDWGGIINLTLAANKLRFEINVDAAAQTRLKISSKLLALAKIVRMEPPS